MVKKRLKLGVGKHHTEENYIFMLVQLKYIKKQKENIELMNLLKDNDMNYGNIICKCNLIDCVRMTTDYVEDMRKNNYQEYICGEYSEGRYAWILENIEILDKPISAKGHLSIWNYSE